MKEDSGPATQLTVGPRGTALTWHETFCTCGASADRRGLKAPPGWYRCPSCRAATPRHLLVRRTAQRFGGGLPADYRIRAAVAQESGDASVTLGPLTFTRGSTAIIHIVANAPGSVTTTFGAQTASFGTSRVSAGGRVGHQYIADIAAIASTLTVSFAAPIPTIKLIAVTELYRAAVNSYSDHFAVGVASGASVSTTASTPPGHVGTTFFGTIWLDGPATDPAGKWTNGYSDLFRIGTISQASDTDNRIMTIGVSTQPSGDEPQIGVVWSGNASRSGKMVGDGWFR